MIPVKLKMRNFMCYRDNVPELDFTGIHLACLSGDNGNGKSAIIDAMTWVLWGKTRAGSDDDLIHITHRIDRSYCCLMQNPAFIARLSYNGIDYWLLI